MRVKNQIVYGLDQSIIRSGYPHTIGEPKDIKPIQESTEYQINQDRLRAYKLANTPIGSGHNNFLKGIIVQFDLCYSQYITPQLQRYNWIDIISSQSKMVSLTKIESLINHCNKYVLERVAMEVDCLIEIYNADQFPYTYQAWSTCYEGYTYIHIQDKDECFQYIISNCPLGFELWMGISTSYLQLKTIWNQRCKVKHKLYDWREFGEFIKTLPMSELITGKSE